MRLYLVQHANAVDEKVDPQRPLSQRGLADCQKVAAFIRPLNLSVGCIWHSGKTRADQTAEIFAPAMHTSEGPIQHPNLAPNDDVTVIGNELAADKQDLMIVGHLPFLSRLTGLLLTGTQGADVVAFQQGGIVCLQRWEQNPYRIVWMVTPDLFD